MKQANKLYFTYHLVNIKPYVSKLKLDITSFFTYHLVNIKPKLDAGELEEYADFTYHLVNIKHMDARIKS
ncbi:hypothetical protein QSG_1450 [Clostridioides difficile P25]|nr:hypothetical protein QSG_1450 [Clostridioides difficile P25]